MSKLEKLIEEARELPPEDRARLVEAVGSTLVSQAPAGRGYAALIAMAGTVTTDFEDVSIDKLKHLAEAYASRPGDE
jgi:hypothetical protein